MRIKIGFVPSRRMSHSAWCEELRQRNIAMLEAEEEVDLVVPAISANGVSDPATGATAHGTVNTLDEAVAVAEFFRRTGVQGIIICPLDFGDERSAVKVAEILKVPVLLYATKEPPAATDASLARISDSYCGNLSIAAGLHRRRIAFRFAGIYLPQEPELIDEVRTFVRAVAVAETLRGARIGQVGVRPPTFESVAYDEVAMAHKFGQNVIPSNISDLVNAARSIPGDDPRLAALVAEIRSTVAEITVSERYLKQAAKLELALVQLFEKERLSALAMQCWPSIQEEMGISVCATFGRLTERGLLTACETDVLGALSMLACYGASLAETVPHFIDWTIQHREDENLFLAWHCGNAPPCLAHDVSKTALRSRRDMCGILPALEEDRNAGLYQFQLRPGIVTICRLAEYDGEWKMLIARGEIEPSDETLAGTWAWVRVSDHAKLYRTLVEEGFIHHASMIHGDLVRPLEEACRFLGVSPVVVL